MLSGPANSSPFLRRPVALSLLGVAIACFALPACGSDEAQPASTSSAAASGTGGAGGDVSSTSTGGAAAAGGGGGTGGSIDPALDEACTPTFTLELEDTGPNGQLFVDAIPDPEAFVQEIGRTVCKILYRHADEVRDANHITLLIRDDPAAGWKSGDVGDITVMVSSNHLATIAAQGDDVAEEIKGILLHEMTHMYQNDDKAPGEGDYVNIGNVIEGIADFVRIRAGSPPLGAKPAKSGVWDDQGYWKPAYFLLWIDVQYPDFLYQLNLAMKAGDGLSWSPDTIETITGQSVDALWTEYQSAACCKGTTQDCCH